MSCTIFFSSFLEFAVITLGITVMLGRQLLFMGCETRRWEQWEAQCREQQPQPCPPAGDRDGPVVTARVTLWQDLVR